MFLSRVDQREIEPTPETKSGKTDDDSVQTLIPNTQKDTSIPNPNRNTLVTKSQTNNRKQKTISFEQFETQLTLMTTPIYKQTNLLIYLKVNLMLQYKNHHIRTNTETTKDHNKKIYRKFKSG